MTYNLLITIINSLCSCRIRNTTKFAMSTLQLCEKFFGTRDVYKLLDLKKSASEKEVKKAYHKLSLLVHPDRVPEEQNKKEATEKFKVLSKLYQVLTDTKKRALYDQQGLIADEDDDHGGELSSCLDLWSKIFKPLSEEEDISNFEKDYIDSQMERQDITKAYLEGKGCINYLLNQIPFMKVQDEPRLKRIVQRLIAAGEVPEYKIFTEEPAAKRKRRHQKYARESKEDEVMKQQIQRQKRQKDDQELAANGGDLQQMILARRTQREANFNTLMEHLIEKYVGQNDSLKTKKGKKPKNSAKQTSKNHPSGVKTGRVVKAKH